MNKYLIIAYDLRYFNHVVYKYKLNKKDCYYLNVNYVNYNNNNLLKIRGIKFTHYIDEDGIKTFKNYDEVVSLLNKLEGS